MPKTTPGLMRLEWGCLMCGESNSSDVKFVAGRGRGLIAPFVHVRKCAECPTEIVVTMIPREDYK